MMNIDSTTSDEELRANLITLDYRGKEVKTACLEELLRRQRIITAIPASAGTTGSGEVSSAELYVVANGIDAQQRACDFNSRGALVMRYIVSLLRREADHIEPRA